ncbi:MAG: DUF6114 domain-containing protein [Candidatus Caldarchaeum sp.]|jgi:hypothetical protein
MSDASRPAAAFAVSLVAGVLILVGGLMGMVAWMAWGGMSYWGGGWGMMGPMMMGWWLPMWFSAFSVLGLVSGIVIIASAMMLQNSPSEAKTWGTLILVFSVVSLFGMGGFLIGAILGIVGGILALTWRAA